MARRVVLVLCAVQFVDVLGVTSGTTAIPAVLADLGAGPSAAAPLAVAYPMFFGGLLVLGARLGDRYGSRRVLAYGVAVFTGAAVAGGLGQDVGQLLTPVAPTRPGGYPIEQVRAALLVKLGQGALHEPGSGWCSRSRPCHRSGARRGAPCAYLAQGVSPDQLLIGPRSGSTPEPRRARRGWARSPPTRRLPKR